MHILSKHIALIAACAGVVWFATGCALFQPPLSVEQAVARLVPFDPPIAQANHLIGDREIELAVQLWIREEVVPNTGGKRIDDLTLKRLVRSWAQQVFI